MMIKRNLSAFTLIELTVALGIFTFVGTMLMFSLKSASREAEFGEKHFQSILLGQKVIEDLHEELWLNPNGFSILAIDSCKTKPTRIINGESIFFTHLQNSSPPWDYIDFSEGVLDSQKEPLYSQVSDFFITIETSRRAAKTSSSPDKNLYNGTINFSWRGKNSPGDFQIDAIFYAPITKKEVNVSALIDDSGITSNASYVELIGKSGGNNDLVSKIGKLNYIGRSFITSSFLKGALNEIQQLNIKADSAEAASNMSELYQHRSDLAKIWYEVAKQSLHILYYLETTMSFVSSNFSTSNLGPGLSGGYSYLYQSGFRDFDMIYETFVGAMRQYRSNSQSLLTKDLSSQRGIRQQYMIMMKLIDCYRVMAMIKTYPDGMAEYKDFLESLKIYASGRNPSLERFVVQEIDWATTPEELASHYPALTTVFELLQNKLPPLLDFAADNTAYIGFGYTEKKAASESKNVGN
ncbi:MAG: type II secretion system protein [Candidatus Riflebacteria bacterium]|nr:type II secretion system protein [Candidatus Riflebacteria bacterium]